MVAGKGEGVGQDGGERFCRKAAEILHGVNFLRALWANWCGVTDAFVVE